MSLNTNVWKASVLVQTYDINIGCFMCMVLSGYSPLTSYQVYFSQHRPPLNTPSYITCSKVHKWLINPMQVLKNQPFTPQDNRGINKVLGHRAIGILPCHQVSPQCAWTLRASSRGHEADPLQSQKDLDEVTENRLKLGSVGACYRLVDIAMACCLN